MGKMYISLYIPSYCSGMDIVEIIFLVRPLFFKVVDEKLEVVRDPRGLDGA